MTYIFSCLQKLAENVRRYNTVTEDKKIVLSAVKRISLFTLHITLNALRGFKFTSTNFKGFPLQEPLLKYNRLSRML